MPRVPQTWKSILPPLAGVLLLSVATEARGQVRETDLRRVFPNPATRVVLQRAETGRADTVSLEGARSARPGDLLIPDAGAREPSYTLLQRAGGQADLVVSFPAFFAVSESGSTIPLTPVMRAIGGGIRFEDGAYRGTLLVGLRDSSRPDEGVTLPQPVRLQVVAIDRGTLDPSRVDVAHTNPPYLEIGFLSSSADSVVRLSVFTPGHPDGIVTDIPVTRPKLILHATPSQLQGWGLERTTLTVELPRGAAQGSTRVTLVSERASPDPQTLEVAPGQSGQADLRSFGLGTASVRAVSAELGLESDPVEIRFGFPWRFLVFVLVGSIVGGVLRSIRGNRERAVQFLAEAILTGALVTIAYVIGINLLGVVDIGVPRVLNEALVLTLAALGAYIGLPRFGGEPQARPAE